MKSLMTIVLLALSVANVFASNLPALERIRNGIKNPSMSKEIVFIHGLYVTSDCWKEWERYFADQGFKTSAPEWPNRDRHIDDLKKDFKAHTSINFTEILDVYRKELRAKKVKPVLVGHSLGGLIAQILLQEGLAESAVAIHPAPPFGVLDLSPSFVRSNFPVLNILEQGPIHLTEKEFTYAFTNAQTKETQESAYQDFYIPESRKAARASLSLDSKINPDKIKAPLFIIAGSEDHIIPAELNFRSFNKFRDGKADVTFKLYSRRDHWTIAAPGWEKIAKDIANWVR